MATLTEYTGNAGLGAGSNGDIPVLGNENLDLVNQTGRDIMLLNAQQNQRLFQQKLNDRDTLRQMVIDGQVPPGEIDEKYRPVYDEAEKRSRDAFDKIKNLNDTKAIEDYYKAKKDLQDVTDHARHNTLLLTGLRKEAAAQTLPRKQKAYMDWLNNQTTKTDSDFWSTVDPYQQTFDLNLKPILDSWKTGTRQLQSPDGLFTFDETYGDYGGTLKDLQGKYLEDADTAEDMRQLLSSYQNMPPSEVGRNIDAIDAQIDKYNKERGLTAGQPDFVPFVKRQQLPNGQIAIAEMPYDFASKYALANQSTFKNQTSKFNKDLANFRVDLGELGVKQGRMKAQNAQDYASAENARANAEKTRAELKQMQDTDPNKFNAFDKIIALSGGKDFVEGHKITPLDMSALGGFDLTKDENGTQSITPKGGFYRPDKNPYILIGKDVGGNQYIRLPIGRNAKGEPITKDIYRDDVINNQNLLTTQIGAKGEQIFGQVQKTQPQEDGELSNDASAWKQEGKNWRYKDGSLYNSKGKKIN